MNIEQLLKRLANVLPTQGQSTPAQLFQQIKSTLSTNCVDPEPNVNKVEELLIKAIQSENNKKQRNLYRLALKLVLLSRGLYTDELGVMEQTLLMLPHEKSALNPDELNPIYPLNDPRIWDFVNKIRIKICTCLDRATTFATRMEDKFQELIDTLTSLVEKYNRLGFDPTDDCTARESELAHKFYRYQLDYLKRCLALLRDSRVFKTSVEHSVWASAVERSFEDLRPLDSDKLRLIGEKKVAMAIDENSGKSFYTRERALDADITTHLTRLHYYTTRAKARCDFLGHHGETALALLSSISAPATLTPRRGKAPPRPPTLDELNNRYITDIQERFAIEFDCFTQAQSLVLNYRETPSELPKVFMFAAQLTANNNSLGRFLESCAQTLLCTPTKESWSLNFSKLQSVAIPSCWRFKVAELWLCLADYFTQLNPSTVFQRDCAIQCARQVSDRFGTKADLLAKLQLAKIFNEESTIRSHQEELRKLETDSTAESPKNSEAAPFNRRPQFLLCKNLSESFSDKKSLAMVEASVDLSTTMVSDFCELMRDNYPYGLELVIKLLQEPTLHKHVCAVAAVRIKHGEKYTNPLVLCTNVLRKPIQLGTNFDRYLMIWGAIYDNALKNGCLSEQTDAWHKQGLSTNDILVKLYGDIRSYLYPALYHDAILVPGGYNYLTALDSKIYTAQSELCESIAADTLSGDFKFCKKNPMAIFAVMGEAALHSENWFVADLLAKRSISPPIVTKPKKDSLTTEKPTPTPSGENSPRKASGTATPDSASARTSPERPRMLPKRLFGKKRESSVNVTRAGTTPEHDSTQFSSSAPNLSIDANAARKPQRSSSQQPDTPENGSTQSKESSPTKRGVIKPGPISPLDLSRVGPTISPLPSPHVLLADDANGFDQRYFPPRLGFLILALVSWHKGDFLKFTDYIASARKPTEIEEVHKILGTREELCYVKAVSWFKYFETGLDDRWLTPQDKLKFKSTFDGLSGNRRKKLHYDERRMREYTAIKLSKDYLFRALVKDPKEYNPCFQMFPPAAVFFEKFLWPQIAEFDHGTKELEETVIQLGGILKECIETHGHIIAEYSYAAILRKYIDLFRRNISLADMYLTIQGYLHRSERFLTIDPGQKSDLHRIVLKELKKKEKAVNKFGRSFNLINYPGRDSIIVELKEAFTRAQQGGLSMTELQDLLLRKLKDEWFTDELFEWYSTKQGWKTNLTADRRESAKTMIIRHLSLIIKREFKHADQSTLVTRLVSKMESELSSLNNRVFSLQSESTPDYTTPSRQSKETLPGPAHVAHLSCVSRNLSISTTRFLSDCRSTYAPEPSKVTLCTLSTLPFKQVFQDLEFSFQSSVSGEQPQPFCLEILPTSAESTEALDTLFKCFLHAAQIYCYTEKVSLANVTPVRKSEKGFEVLHLDIAILGIIKIIQGGHPGKKSRDSQVAHLVETLEAAQSLEPTLWHGKLTLSRLNTFLEAYLVAAAKRIAGNLSPPASPHTSVSPPPRRIFSLPDSQVVPDSRAVSRRGSFIHPGDDPTDPHSNPRDGAERKGSLKVVRNPRDVDSASLAAEASGEIPIVRARSQTAGPGGNLERVRRDTEGSLFMKK